MKQSNRMEFLVLFFAGAFLVIHAIAVCVHLVTGISAEQIAPTNSVASLIGEVAAMLCFFGLGIAVLGLAWGKRTSRNI